MTDTSQTIRLGELQPANVGELEAGLSALWRSAAEDPSLRNAVTRACAFTLLIYLESEEAGREVSNLIGKITVQNPCRTIVMVAEPEAKPASLTAWISAHCHLPAAGEKQVCSEQVTLRAQGEAVQGLPSVVLPLTVSGLPVYLWWRAGHFAPPAYFDQIFRITNHLIVDSARFSGSGTDLQGVAAWLQKSLGAVAVTDLNWTRITPWRELLAQCFDAPERRPFLDRLSEVRIEYEQESVRLPTQRAQSLLLTGWLASRLGWEFVGQRAQEEGTPRSFLFTSGKRAIRVERLLRRIEGDGSGVCFAIELEANGAAPARFSLARGVDGKVVQTCAEVAGQPPLGRTVRLEVLDEVEILNEELKLARRDRIYEEALQMAARMTATSG